MSGKRSNDGASSAKVSTAKRAAIPTGKAVAKRAVAKQSVAKKAAAKTVAGKSRVQAPALRKTAVPVTRAVVKSPGRGSGRTAAPVRAASTRLVRIKALDPCARCGPRTSVEQLYRVDEQVAGTATVHLVFFDRHGWYCVHGASCVAVRDVHAELKAQRAGSGRRR